MKRHLLSGFGLLFSILITTASWSQSISEGFESGLPSTPPSTPADYTLSSGVWTIYQANSTTTARSGSLALLLNSGSANNPSSAAAPSVSQVSTVTFFARTSAKSKLKMQKSVNGGSYSDITTLNTGTSYTSYTVTVNETSTNVRIRFANPGSATGYVDDVTINSSATPPPSGTNPTSWYVSPTGNDANTGTVTSPFKTVSKAVSMADAGDTVFLRGGNHLYTTTISISKSGTSSARFYLFAYPGERPVLDFSGMAVSTSNRGVSLTGSYWHFKGIDFYKAGDNGMIISGGSNNIIEWCAFYENADTGLQLGAGASNNQIINCDSYYNMDATHGNADGFAPKLDVGTGNSFKGCRAWQNSDDGWDGLLNSNFGQNPSTTYENCWCFSNGYLKSGALSNGNGNGFKMGGNQERHDATLTNCLAYNNKAKGFDQNNNTGSMILYNCTGYMNGVPAVKGNFGMNNVDPANGEVMIVKNCISYKGGAPDVFRAVAQLSHNSWQNGLVVSDADFVSLVASQLSAPRKSDGSLPDITFLHLASGSDMIDAGTNVGLPYNGTAPDLGCFETGAAARPANTSPSLVRNSSLAVYPNPATSASLVRFTNEKAGYLTVKLMNSIGQLVKVIYQGQADAGKSYNLKVDVSPLSSGTYYIVMDDGRRRTTNQLLVTH